jgi:hypothetical protein
MAAPVATALGQNPSDTSRTAQDSVLRAFFDCPNFDRGCDFDFMRTEIGFVNWVRNRQDAHVHILISTQRTGGGGDDYTITFIGLQQFRATTDTLHYVSNATDTRDEIRKGLARVLKLGLVRFVAGTPLAGRLDVTYQAPAGTRTAAAVQDPWDNWVFRISMNGNYSAQKSNNDLGIFATLSANRVTERWKIRLSVNGGYTESNFHLRIDSVTAETFRSLTRNYGASALVVRSAGGRWSAGLRGSITHSTFLNQRHQIRFAPALEYDFFPYTQSTRRLVTLQYAVGVAQFAYTDTTIYQKTAEALPVQTLTLSVAATQPWGTVSGTVEGSAFYRGNTLNKNKLSFFGSTQVRLLKGLSINFFGNAEIVHDQLFLSGKGVDAPTLLLRRRQLETSFFYQTFVGLSYSFGSIYNNIVNPRFEGGGGFFFFSN